MVLHRMALVAMVALSVLVGPSLMAADAAVAAPAAEVKAAPAAPAAPATPAVTAANQQQPAPAADVKATPAPKPTASGTGFEYEYREGLKLRLGADMRMRFEGFDRNVIWPDDGIPPNGPDIFYYRMRTRVWASIDLTPDIAVNGRLTHRWQHFFSHTTDPNNNGYDTWRLEDEVVADQLNIVWKEILDSDWAITLGRQDMKLGNGLLFCEGTPYDTGRTIYFDGVSVRYAGQADTLTLYSFYNDYKDKALAINDQNRRLRRGDTFTTGAYWTHKFDAIFNTDLYYNYTLIDDDRWYQRDAVERNHPMDENATINTYGGRIFGSPHKLVDYSVEMALQDGCFQNSQEMTGMLGDARLTFKAPEDTLFRPSIMFEYTYLSGNDPRSTSEFEGWHPLFGEYPIWREELLPIMLNGNWTNLNQWRAEGKLNLPYDIGITVAYAHLIADAGEAGTGGGGNRFGELISAFVDWKYNAHLSFALESAYFFPGDYWTDGHNSMWYRAQAIYTF